MSDFGFQGRSRSETVWKVVDWGFSGPGNVIHTMDVDT